LSEAIEATAGQQVERRAVVYLYTQTGQLREVAEALTGPLVERGWQIRWVTVQPRTQFPFPWPIHRFFGVFPQTVDPESSVELIEPADGFRSGPDELVILAYQVWFLAPSLPVRTLLNTHPETVRDRAVVSLVACRNMWYSAAVEMSMLLQHADAQCAGAVAATDTHASFTTIVTTLRWLLTGRRDPFLWFSRAGVSDEELARVAAVGRQLARGSMPCDAAPVVPTLAAADLLAGRIFRKWATTIKRSHRFGPTAHVITLMCFVCALTVGVVVGLPLITVVAAAGGTRFADAVRNFVDRRISFGEWSGHEGVTP
jgi:hypothetical protein